MGPQFREVLPRGFQDNFHIEGNFLWPRVIRQKQMRAGNAGFQSLPQLAGLWL